MDKKTTSSWEDIKKELLKNPATYKEYKSLEPEYKIISQMIKIRTEQGLTQKELADKIGTRQSNISRLESGEYNPSLEFLKKVAIGLDKELIVSLN